MRFFLFNICLVFIHLSIGQVKTKSEYFIGPSVLAFGQVHKANESLLANYLPSNPSGIPHFGVNAAWKLKVGRLNFIFEYNRAVSNTKRNLSPVKNDTLFLYPTSQVVKGSFNELILGMAFPLDKVKKRNYLLFGLGLYFSSSRKYVASYGDGFSKTYHGTPSENGTLNRNVASFGYLRKIQLFKWKGAFKINSLYILPETERTYIKPSKIYPDLETGRYTGTIGYYIRKVSILATYSLILAKTENK